VVTGPSRDGQPGPRRLDDWKTVSGIMHCHPQRLPLPGSPCRLRPSTTICNCSNRWSRRGFWRDPPTTRRDRDARPAPDPVDRKFTADLPDQLWVADMTYVPTISGFLYLAIVLNAFSRKIVGWSMANHLRTEVDPIPGTTSAGLLVGDRPLRRFPDHAAKEAFQCDEHAFLSSAAEDQGDRHPRKQRPTALPQLRASPRGWMETPLP